MNKIILAVVVFFGCLLLFGAVNETIRLRAEKNWPTVTGVVESAKHFSSEGQNWVDVEITYEVGGKRYSELCSVDTESSSVPKAYQPDSSVQVHYDASRPDHAYLKHAGFESPIALAIFGGVVLLICSPFVAYYGLLLYVDMMLRKAQYHMREGLKAIEEGQNEIDAMRARDEEVPPELLEMEKEIIEQAYAHYEMFGEVEAQRKSFD